MGNPNDSSSEAMRMDDNGAPTAPVPQSGAQPEVAVVSEPPKPSFFGENPALEMMRLALRIVLDRPPDLGIDGGERVAYIHALSPDDTEGNIARGVELYQEGFVDLVYVLGLGRKYKGQYGTPAMADDEPRDSSAQMIHSGFREWRLILQDNGVPEDKIMVLELEHPEYQAKHYHTHTEAKALMNLIETRRRITRLIVISSAWHIVRAACEVVSQVIFQGFNRENNFLPVYMATAYTHPARAWTQAGLGSQSTAGAGTPIQELANEFAKLKAYCEKGDLKPAQEILAYFDQRDAHNS